ncbi:hypothetical protein [Streptomyces sp. N35]|uniref:hypothetical protein n=1 Tax=Streptomyces sp. N35 TaxID=2795730 RepID=UPI0018F64E36|nr:hypothetical protein [Streptomyces sp. N35]
MSAAVVETELAKFLADPEPLLAVLHGAQKIKLRCTGGEGLILNTALRADQDAPVLIATRRMAAAMLRTSAGRALFLDVLPTVFPWARFLSASDVRDFAVELAHALDTDDPADTSIVAQLIAEWQHTAEVQADPELYAVLTTDSPGDFGPVPEPGSAE